VNTNLNQMSEIEVLKERTALLGNISVFAGLNHEALHQLAALLNPKTARAQEQIFRKGDDGDEMYIILDGEIRVHDGNHVIVRLKAGDIFGEYALIDNEKRSASVTTETPCDFLVLKRNDFSLLMATQQGIMLGMLQAQIKRMREMNELKEKLAKSYLKISKQKEEIEQQNDAIKEKNELVEEQNIELRKLNEHKRKLMSILIHGLKNPLTSALMMTDMIEQNIDNKEDVLDYLGLLKQSMQRMDQVFNEIIRSNQREEAD
jgi:CRP-like cAMP-binding protein